MNDEIQAALTELRAGVAARDRDAVEDAIGQLEFFIVEDGAWPHALFDGARDLLRDPGFLAVQSSYRLVYVLAGNWDDLSAEQRAELRPILAGAFDKFGDWLGAFILAEIFGERYSDDAAFTTLDDLSSAAATMPCRALAAYGLGRLARTLEEGPPGQEGALYRRAIERLHVLANSTDHGIREEALGALANLRKTP